MYKNDGNALGKPTYIWLHELTPDGTATVGEPIPLIRNTLVRRLLAATSRCRPVCESC